MSAVPVTAAAPLPVRPRRRFRLPFSPWHLVLVPATILLLFPFVWLLITSLETSNEALRFPPLLTPHVLRFGNYSAAWHSAPFGRFFLNSTVVAVCTVLAITKWLGVHVLAGVGINHLGALILPNAATAFGIFFLRQFFRTLPIEYEESARVDGASRLTVLRKIVLPLSAPPLATLAALTFLDSWNNFLWPLIAVTSTSQMTVPLGLATFQGAHQTEIPQLMAGNVMSLLPMLLIFFLAQRYFIRSVAATGLAGS
jgi:multiple sugar transport system permease protein